MIALRSELPTKQTPWSKASINVLIWQYLQFIDDSIFDFYL